TPQQRPPRAAGPLIELGSSRGNMFATWPRTLFLSLAGSTHPSTVTSTISNGKIEKNAQKAIMAAMFADWSSLNFLNVATVTLVGSVLFWASRPFAGCSWSCPSQGLRHVIPAQRVTQTRAASEAL